MEGKTLCTWWNVGVNYWDTYSPVVSWSTVQLIFTLSLILGWHMHSIDFILAYPQADVKVDIFMRPPKGCKLQGCLPGKHLLKLHKNLYGLKDSGHTWYEHIWDSLIRQGFKITAVDPCLFTKVEVILILYVDDAVIISPDQEAITRVVKSLEKVLL